MSHFYLNNNFFEGSLQTSYSLASEQHIPERMKKMIDETTSSMTENGLHYFYKSFTSFLQKLRVEELSDAEKDDFEALNVDELRAPLIFCCYLAGFSVLLFLVEMIVSKFKKRSNRKPKRNRDAARHQVA